MSFLRCQCAFGEGDQSLGTFTEVIDSLSFNLEEVSSYNPATDKSRTIVSLKNSEQFEILIGYDEFEKILVRELKQIKSNFIILHTTN